MKKLILSAAILLCTMTAITANTLVTIPTNKIEHIQDEYKEVAIDSVPEAVLNTLKNSFPAAKLEKAYTNEEKEYKLEISMSDNMYTIYTDAEGAVIKK
ncbi:hypothetical protein [Flavobacterium faecale]|uniref:hypothetical protein n=1 Tax=Flavobacterium faecale TaxID=1355330 RepID=UPI003AB0CEAF